MEVTGQLHAPATLPPGERAPLTHWIGDWMGPRAGLDAMMRGKKTLLCQELNFGRPSHSLFSECMV